MPKFVASGTTNSAFSRFAAKVCVETDNTDYIALTPITTFNIKLKVYVGCVSSVGIENGYGLDGPGIETWWARDFPRPFRMVLWPT